MLGLAGGLQLHPGVRVVVGVALAGAGLAFEVPVAIVVGAGLAVWGVFAFLAGGCE